VPNTSIVTAIARWLLVSLRIPQSSQVSLTCMQACVQPMSPRCRSDKSPDTQLPPSHPPQYSSPANAWALMHTMYLVIEILQACSEWHTRSAIGQITSQHLWWQS
jgi:hypothetical protein